MKKTIVLIVFLLPLVCFGQSLGSERVDILKKSVVRVLIDSLPSGTGFFVQNDGWIATCQHVIEPAMIRDSITNQIIGLKKMYIEFQNGEKVEAEIMAYLLQNGYTDALVYDYSLLKVKTTPITKFKTLKIGKWLNAFEGDEIYSCGYPLGIQQRFVSKGIISSKWADTISTVNKFRVTDKKSRNVAWLDLTMNKGNSGGPIIKMGKKPEEDEVIGIATFILNPYAKTSKYMVDYLPNRGIDMQSEGISQNQLMQILFEAISNNSIGVSGCLSIDYVSSIINALNN